MQTKQRPERLTKIELGAQGEALAAAYLVEQGMELLDRNWRCGRSGELDLLMRDGDTAVAVEVKTRSGTGYGSGFAAITAEKCVRLRKLMAQWLATQDAGFQKVRIDAVSVLVQNARAEISYLRGIA